MAITVLQQLIMATAHSWNDAGSNRAARARNFNLVEDQVTGANTPTIAETVHKAINMTCNQRPSARRIIGQVVMNMAFDPTATDPDTALQLQTSLEFMQHPGQGSFIYLLDGMLSYVPEILSYPDFAPLAGRVMQMANTYTDTDPVLRPFLNYLALNGYQQFWQQIHRGTAEGKPDILKHDTARAPEPLDWSGR